MTRYRRALSETPSNLTDWAFNSETFCSISFGSAGRAFAEKPAINTATNNVRILIGGSSLQHNVCVLPHCAERVAAKCRCRSITRCQVSRHPYLILTHSHLS